MNLESFYNQHVIDTYVKFKIIKIKKIYLNIIYLTYRKMFLKIVFLSIGLNDLTRCRPRYLFLVQRVPSDEGCHCVSDFIQFLSHLVKSIL